MRVGEPSVSEGSLRLLGELACEADASVVRGDSEVYLDKEGRRARGAGCERRGRPRVRLKLRRARLGELGREHDDVHARLRNLQRSVGGLIEGAAELEVVVATIELGERRPEEARVLFCQRGQTTAERGGLRRRTAVTGD